MEILGAIGWSWIWSVKEHEINDKLHDFTYRTLAFKQILNKYVFSWFQDKDKSMKSFVVALDAPVKAWNRKTILLLTS